MARREGDFWREQVQRGGVRHSSTFRTKQEAEAWKAQILEDWKYQRTGSTRRHPLDAAIIKWAEEELPRQKARVTTANHAAQLTPFTANKSLEDIPAVWAAYKKANPKLKPATLNKKGAVLRRIANLAFKEWKWIHTPIHITLLPENNQRQTYLTKSDLSKLVFACPCYETRILIKVLYYTGMRISEVLAAVPVKGVLHVRDTKGNKPAYIPMHREILPYAAVFPFKHKYKYYYKRFVLARKAAGFPNLHIHDIRHSTASALVKSGATLVEVRDVMRHASLQTTNRYLHLLDDGMKTAINRL